MNMSNEKNYIWDEFDFSDEEEIVKKKTICVAEIWCECFQKDRAELRRRDSFEIEDVLKKIGGWEKLSAKLVKKRYKLYGPQKTYVKR